MKKSLLVFPLCPESELYSMVLLLYKVEITSKDKECCPIQLGLHLGLMAQWLKHGQ